MPKLSESTFRVDETTIPGWWIWQSTYNRQWHARKKGTDTPVLVHGNNVEDLREETAHHDGRQR